MIEISVIIPVFNSESFLLELLESIRFQTINKHLYEVIFVDNGSTDNSKDIIKSYLKDNSNIRLLEFLEKPSSYAARNYAINHAKGAILAFTDSDCILSPEWLTSIYESLSKGTVLSGEIELRVIDNKNIWEIFDSNAHLNNQYTSSMDKVATANMAVYKDDFSCVGDFLEVYSGGDYEWSTRAKKNGLKIKYLERMKVYHPTRKTFDEIRNKSVRIAFGHGEKFAEKGNIISLLVLYIAKVFHIKTNIRHSKILKNNGVGLHDIFRFNMLFLKIRVLQIVSAIDGFNKKDARKLNLR